MTPSPERVRAIALTLTGWPSVTGTADEAAFSGKLAHYLEEIGGLEVWTKPIPGDALGRANVFALKRGKGRKTVLLAGHFDTVPADDYGALKPLAFEPERLLGKTIARLRESGEHALALADLESGDYLPGRGLLDMKAGLAAGIAVLEAHEGEGNLLLVATPDEEDRSAGMRAAASQIATFTKEQGLDITLAINLDSIADDGDGSFGRSIAFGSIGKLLLTAFVVGREAHACYPFQGINANYLAGALLTAFECAPELAELTGDEIAAPPTALQAKDLKSGYNVTTPAQVWLYWNTLQHKRSAAEVLEIAIRLARAAVASAVAQLDTRARSLKQQAFAGDIPVLTYTELVAGLDRASLDQLGAKLARRDLDLPTRCLRLTQEAWRLSGRAGPAVIIGFGSIPSQAVTLGDDALRRRLIAAVAGDVNPIGYFPGISDMSFLGRGSGGLEPAAANTPIWHTSFALDPSPGYQIVNIGPWGRDYHHWLERLNAPFAFNALPGLIQRVARAGFEAD
ncbi:MAG: M20/M25/M40 family metallo-hydrolase [Rhizobiales bacterium]|nr:M20/M25/M40 family metallo-hydrolase [Hyphomicrobiales bacterium]